MHGYIHEFIYAYIKHKSHRSSHHHKIISSAFRWGGITRRPLIYSQAAQGWNLLKCMDVTFLSVQFLYTSNVSKANERGSLRVAGNLLKCMDVTFLFDSSCILLLQVRQMMSSLMSNEHSLGSPRVAGIS